MAKTQVEKVVDYIDKHGSITSLEAYVELGITQLGARIWELENRGGYRIKHEPKTVTNRNGDKIRDIAYSWQISDDSNKLQVN